MKKNFFMLFMLTSLLLISQTIFAHPHTCPPLNKIKNMQLMDAWQDPDDPGEWSFISNVLTTTDGQHWNVWFGTFLSKANTKEEALQQGRIYFSKITPPITQPTPVEVPDDVTLCDYVPTGMDYYLSAVNPPQYQ